MYLAHDKAHALGAEREAAIPEVAAWQSHFRQKWQLQPRFPFAAEVLREDFVDAMRRLVPEHAAVLEVGCGAAETLAALPNAVRHGIDVVPEAVAAARRAAPGCEIHEGDALTFRRAARYDAIICDRLVHSVHDVQRLLTNLAGHLTDDGRIFLTCFNSMLEPAHAVAEIAGVKLRTPPMNWFSEIDISNLFRLAGLEVVRFEDRLLVPLPGARLINRCLAPMPGLSRLTFYRVYVLRKQPALRARKESSVTVVVPARNESGNVTDILRRTPKMGTRTELIFVEGNSTDDTWDVIRREVAAYRGPLVVSCCQQPGRGKGDAVREGFSRAAGDILMILDADMAVEPEELPKFYQAATRHVGDYIHGTRLVYPMEEEAMRFLNRLGNIAFGRLFTFLLNQPIKDTLCGTKVIWRADYERLAKNRPIFGDFDPFGDFDLIFGATHLNLMLLEIPVRYRNRTYGETNISRFRHGMLLLKMSGVAARNQVRMRRALITGITGQDGSYLTELLLSKGYEVHGVIRRASTFNTDRIDHLYRDRHESGARLFLHHGDLSEGTSLRRIVERVRPDEVYNLGAQSHVKVSFEEPEYTGDADALGALRLFECIRDFVATSKTQVRIYQAGSSEMFGAAPPPQRETTPFYPRSPYAVSKLAAHWYAVNYREAYGLFLCNGILFNHESPRRGETFVTRKITRAVGRIRHGLQDKLYLGNVDAKRDWGFAGDYVEAMWAMLQQDAPGDYVVATGDMRTVRDLLDVAFTRIGRDWAAHVEIDPRYFRPTEVDALQGDARKAREVLGWAPRVGFRELVEMMVDHDLELAAQEAALKRLGHSFSPRGGAAQ